MNILLQLCLFGGTHFFEETLKDWSDVGKCGEVGKEAAGEGFDLSAGLTLGVNDDANAGQKGVLDVYGIFADVYNVIDWTQLQSGASKARLLTTLAFSPT